MTKTTWRWLTAAMVAGAALGTYRVTAQTQAETNIASATIDLGTVVSDAEKSVKWYRDVIGFEEAATFDFPGDFAKEIGLTNSLPGHVHVMKLGTGPGATSLKLMQFKTAPGARVDQTFIHSTYGFRYLTIIVKDMPTAMARAAKHGVKPISGDAVAIPETIAKGQYIAVLRDPDGNFVELVGPKAE